MIAGSFHQLRSTDFGNPAEYVENKSPASSSVGIFAQYLRLTTPDLLAGLYRIGWVFQYEASAASTLGEYRLEVDDSINVDQETLTIASAGERKTYSNFSFENLGAGIHNIDLDFRRFSGAGAFTIDDAKIELWRVS